MNDKNTPNLQQLIGEDVDPQSAILIGLGNVDRADDGLGLILVSKIKTCFPKQAFIETECTVEGIVMDKLENDDVSTFIFVDAVDFGGEPGDIQIFNIHDAQRFMPTFSTHKVPISLLMGLINQKGKSSYLLGVQPLNLEFFGEVSPLIGESMQIVEKSLTVFLQGY